MIKTTLRWLVLLVALALAATSLLMVFKAPVWLDWRLRMLVGMLVGECGLWFALLPLSFGTAAWLMRRGRPALAATTLGVCAVACVLMLKPTAQAWWLARAMPAQLAAAFGPAAPERAPFSLAACFARAPERVTVKTMKYTDLLKLEFYHAVGRSPAPCIVALHGGAWYLGDRKESRAIQQSNRWLAQHGYAVASIDYRLVPQAIWPAQRDDVLAAIAFLRERATELEIDPARIVLLGRSAGGQLAEAVAYAAHDSGICGVIALYAPADMKLGWDSSSTTDSFNQRQILQQFLGGTPATARDAYESSSGARLVSPGAPPTLLLHGQVDTIVPDGQSELMARKLAAAGVPHTLILLPWATHGFDYINFDSPGAQITTYAMEWFLSVVTR
jgi:acetyl esterase/lipase